MHRSYKVTIGSLAAGLALAMATPAAAQLQTKNQTKCITGVNKAAAKVQSAARKTAEECLRFALSGQNVLDCVTRDERGRIGSAAEKLASIANASYCTADPPDFGFTSGLLANAAALLQERNLAEDIFGSDFLTGSAPMATDAASRLCRDTVARDYGRVASTVSKAFLACKKTGLSLGSIDSEEDLEACLGQITSDSNELVEKAMTTFMLDTLGACDVMQLDEIFGGVCNDSVGVLAFGECLNRTVQCRTCIGLNGIDGLSADCDVHDDGEANYSCPPGSAPPTTTSTTLDTSTTTLDTSTTTLDTTTTTLDTTTTTTSSTTTTSTTTTTTTTTTQPGVLIWTFPGACVDVTLNVPTLGGDQQIKGVGSVTVKVDLTTLRDAPGSGRNEIVDVEITNIDFSVEDETGENYSKVKLYPEEGIPLSGSGSGGIYPHIEPHPSIGTIRENNPGNPQGTFDVKPYGLQGTGTATVTAFIHAEIKAALSETQQIHEFLHHDVPMTLVGTFTNLPPAQDEFVTMTNTSPIPVRRDVNDAQFLSATITAVKLTFVPSECTPSAPTVP
ncbi:MAG TPA: hypothetical protein VEC57_18515 [Candidatus Limnocylindrales bacterium]|nr:hypothetical protein [Candidatus Limnocylindrales bacterium]